MKRDIAHDDALDRDRTQPSDSWDDTRATLEQWSVDEVDPWAWLERDQEGADPVDTSGCMVTAVLVTLDAGRWLAETLAGLAALRSRPTRLIAIDCNSADSTTVLLRRAVAVGLLDAVYSEAAKPPGGQVSGFGEAVKSALRQDSARQDSARPDSARQDSAQQDSERQDTEAGHQNPPTAPADPRPLESSWLWLLHDDAVPAPDALERLLGHVSSDPSIDVTGPKLLLPKRRHQRVRISEVGVTISGTGRREVLIDPGEVDQGQRDVPVPRLGVSTCGMLVRRSVWESLGGLDADLPVFRDGVDFGWRAHLAGYSVVTTPQARFTHRQVGRAGLRPRGAAGRRPARLDRYLGLLVVVSHASTRRLPLVWLRLVWSCLIRAVGYLFGKVPGRSWDELLALGDFLAHPARIRTVRRRLRQVRRAPGADRLVQTLRPRWSSGLRVGAEALSAAMSDRYRLVAGELETSSIDELTSDDYSRAVVEKPASPWLSPIVIVGILAVLGSLVSARALWGLGSLVAPGLLPAQSRLGALWQAVWSPVVGAPTQSSPPWLALLALGSTVLAGRPEWLVTVLLCAVVPLSLLTSYPVFRKTVDGRRTRVWAALTYALLPVLLGGTNQGRLSISVFAIALPVLVLAARALVLRRPRAPEAWRGGWGAGVVLVALVAFEPSLMLFAMVAAAAGALALRRNPRKVGRIGIALGVPLLVLSPWWPSVIFDWGRLFTGPDSALRGTPPAAMPWELLLGREIGPGLPPLWLGAVVFGVIWTVALVGLGRRPRSRAVLAAWVTSLLAFSVAVLVSRMVVSVPPVRSEVRPDVGAYLLIGFAALLLAGAVGVDGLSQNLKQRSFTWLQPGAVIAAVLVGLVTLLAAGWWVWAGAAGPIQRDRLDALPPYVLNALSSDQAARVLAVDLAGDQARFAVVADDQTRLGDADRGYTFGGSTSAPAEAADLVARLVAGTADADIAPQLRRLGIAFLWITGADEEEKARIDNTPGLGTASGNDGGTIWQLEPEVSRATLADGDTLVAIGGTPVTIGPGEPGRLLRLGEAADPRWRATLDGVPLAPVTDGWQQAFVAPATGGVLSYAMPTITHWLLIGQGTLLLVATVLAAPGIRRPEVRDPTKTARRAATLGGVTP